MTAGYVFADAGSSPRVSPRASARGSVASNKGQWFLSVNSPADRRRSTPRRSITWGADEVAGYSRIPGGQRRSMLVDAGIERNRRTSFCPEQVPAEAAAPAASGGGDSTVQPAGKQQAVLGAVKVRRRCGVEVEDPAKDVDTVYRAALVAILALAGLALTAMQIALVRQRSGGKDPENDDHNAALWSVSILTFLSLLACCEYHAVAAPHLPDEESSLVCGKPKHVALGKHAKIYLPTLKLHVHRFLRRLRRREMSFIFPLLAEIAVLAPHPLPYYTRRRESIWLLSYMFLRLLGVLRVVGLLLPVYRERFDIFSQAHIRGRYAHIRVNWLRVMKFAFLQHTTVTVVVFSVSAMACFSAMVHFAENKEQPDSYTFFGDSFWFMFITYTTIGYGDMYPTTHLGRIITVLAGCMGVIVANLIAGVVAQKMTPSEVDHEMVQWTESRDRMRYMEICQIRLVQLYCRDRREAMKSGRLKPDGSSTNCHLYPSGGGATWITPVTRNAARKARSARLQATETTGDSVSDQAGAMRDVQIFLSEAAEKAEMTQRKVIGIARSIIALQRQLFQELANRAERLDAAELATFFNSENIARSQVQAEEVSAFSTLSNVQRADRRAVQRLLDRRADALGREQLRCELADMQACLLQELAAERERRESDFAQQMADFAAERERRDRDFAELLRRGDEDRSIWAAWRAEDARLAAEQRAEDGRAAAEAHASLLSEHRRGMDMLHEHAAGLREVAAAHREQQEADTEWISRSLQDWAAEQRDFQAKQQRWLDEVLQGTRDDAGRAEGAIRKDLRGVMHSERLLAQATLELREVLRRIASDSALQPQCRVKLRAGQFSAPFAAPPDPFVSPLDQVGDLELQQRAHELMLWAVQAEGAGVKLPQWHAVKGVGALTRAAADDYYKRYQAWIASLDIEPAQP
eukprot:TRINITY_DN25890_c0_g1_i1.p1 TRINITY_DN25890_c0_g1~~TRINITY_DN25890_c0_g1_i1.p1  ORF type:complete len:952 (+),score=208.08 TRINITY_DN25890_c0_g1_i1:91-2856(+)